MLQYDRKDELAGGVAELIAWFPEGDNYFSIEYEKRTDESIREASIDEESVLKSILDKLQFKENDSNYKNDVKFYLDFDINSHIINDKCNNKKYKLKGIVCRYGLNKYFAPISFNF